MPSPAIFSGRMPTSSVAAHVDTALAVDHLTDRPDRRGLARPVGAEQDDDLAFVDVQVDVAEHLDWPVPGIEALDLQASWSSVHAHVALLPR